MDFVVMLVVLGAIAGAVLTWALSRAGSRTNPDRLSTSGETVPAKADRPAGPGAEAQRAEEPGRVVPDEPGSPTS